MDNRTNSDKNHINPEFLEVWDLAKNYSLPETQSNDVAWKKFQDKIQNQPTKHSLKVSYTKIISIAASVILLALVGAYIFFTIKPKTTNQNYITSVKETKNITLPDGSVVILNPNSKLSISFNKNNRNLNLSGNARFEVKRNENAPFVVNTANGNVTVLGTGFDVNAYNNSQFSVYVNHGKVKVESGNEEAILTKGHYIYKSDNHLIQTQKTENPVNLENNLINFNEATLNEVIQTLSQVYSRKISVPNSNTQKLNEKFTGTINYNEDLNDVCKIINVAMNTNLVVM